MGWLHRPDDGSQIDTLLNIDHAETFPFMIIRVSYFWALARSRETTSFAIITS